MSTKDRSYVNERLAEINQEANLREPPFAYWKAMQAAARRDERQRRHREPDPD
jgi:hypothetical protein